MDKVIQTRGLYKTFPRKGGSAQTATHYCPGCEHGVLHKLIGEALADMELQDRTVMISPVGCAVFAYEYFNCDMFEAAHGRAPAVATGLKRALPGRIVFTYQGDGDLASIGGNEILHAAARGEKLTVIFVNNTVYGMTGGQMAPTTLPGQVTSSSPEGRAVPQQGYPMHITEMLAHSPGVAYAVRRSVHSPAEIRRTKKAIRAAFQAQVEGLGLALVEVLSTCPTNWRMSPAAALEHVRDEVAAVYPLGDFKVHDLLA